MYKTFSHWIGKYPASILCLWTRIDSVITFRNLKPKVVTGSRVSVSALQFDWLPFHNVDVGEHLRKSPLLSYVKLGLSRYKNKLYPWREICLWWTSRDPWGYSEEHSTYLTHLFPLPTIWKIKQRIARPSPVPLSFLRLFLLVALITKARINSQRTELDIFATVEVLHPQMFLYLSLLESVTCWVVVIGLLPSRLVISPQSNGAFI